MPHYSYLIIGGGLAAVAAMAGIREVDRNGTIGVIGAEVDPPYDRPPLSKGLWKDKSLEGIWQPLDKTALTLHLGRTARSLDPGGKRVIDDRNTTYTYSKLLLATGCTPRRLPFGRDSIIYFRTLGDYRRLRSLTDHGSHFAVIGSGFIGSEIAAALAMNGKKVTLVFPDQAIGSKMYPPELAQYLNDYYQAKGVTIMGETRIIGCQAKQQRKILTMVDIRTNHQEVLEVDGVVAGIGVEPNVELARAAGIRLDHGIRVDPALRTTGPDIYAAGDVATFFNPSLNAWLRVEHEDNARTMGGFAGVSMAGRSVAYNHLPFFYSDLFDLGYEAVGEIDSRLDIFADWKIPLRQGVIYYLKERRVRGVLFWNIFGQVDAARTLIAASGPFGPANLKGRLPS
jgi:NADPH-dependent 2,4-dienoyl-CoA reductase/sulfur reductase-like enzyme